MSFKANTNVWKAHFLEIKIWSFRMIFKIFVNGLEFYSAQLVPENGLS